MRKLKGKADQQTDSGAQTVQALPGVDAPLTFKGFSPETYRFLIELSLNNHKAFFDANRSRYMDYVQTPMRALAADLMPHMLRVDPEFNTKMISVVSRIYRDARRLRGAPPYRDHMWMSFKRPSEQDEPDQFGMYFEITPDGYGYGMGIYQPSPAFMAAFRARILADPQRFLALINVPQMQKYTLSDERYKRDRFPDVSGEIKTYLNLRRISWTYFNPDLNPTLDAEVLFEEARDALTQLGPLYRFISQAGRAQ